MHVVIATFEQARHSEVFSRALRDDFGVAAEAIGEARVGAYREPHDGHWLVAAWVPPELAEGIRALAQRSGGVLHEPPARITPPATPRSATEDQVAQGLSLDPPRQEHGPA